MRVLSVSSAARSLAVACASGAGGLYRFGPRGVGGVAGALGAACASGAGVLCAEAVLGTPDGTCSVSAGTAIVGSSSGHVGSVLGRTRRESSASVCVRRTGRGTSACALPVVARMNSARRMPPAAKRTKSGSPPAANSICRLVPSISAAWIAARKSQSEKQTDASACMSYCSSSATSTDTSL